MDQTPPSSQSDTHSSSKLGLLAKTPSGYPRQGNKFTRALGKGLLRLMGWTYEGDWPEIPKMVAIGAPHTSNWDLGLAMGMMLQFNMRLSWMMKREAFIWPLSGLWRKLGGIPIERNAAQDIVEQMTDVFRSRDALHLGITPEGTRSKVRGFRKGYLRIAYAADVPVFLVGVDGPNKHLVFDRLWPLTGDLDADNAAIEDYYRTHYQGIHADKT